MGRSLYVGQLTQDAAKSFGFLGGDSRTVAVEEGEDGKLTIVATERKPVLLHAVHSDFEGEVLLSANLALRALSVAI